MNAEDIDKARRTLGLGKTATLKEIKQAYRQLAKQHHPDMKGSKEDMSEVNEAYKAIMDYIECYKYSFTQEEVGRQNPEIAWGERMANDPVWGRGSGKSDKVTDSTKHRTEGF